jgi:membrane associated rhomboid family serine protease
MIPLKDHIPTRRTPIVNYGLIALSILVYGLQMTAGSQADSLVYEFALIPFQLTHSLSLSTITNLFTSMFMHAGLAHLGGNMLYLWIFGDNVEDRMGRGRYLLFYLLGGVVASLTHIVTNPNSQIPTVGASGAIAVCDAVFQRCAVLRWAGCGRCRFLGAHRRVCGWRGICQDHC